MAAADSPQRRLVFDVIAARSLGKVVQLLGEAAIPCAPVKGIVLARWLYEDISERPYVDVDLLVPRNAFERAAALVDGRGWRCIYRSFELGELAFTVDQIVVELHAEVGRRDLSRLTVTDVLDRSAADRHTFPFEIRRIDDIDHFLLLVLNVVKDGFTYANAHQADDLDRLLRRLEPRRAELIARSAAVGMTTALHLIAEWMMHQQTATHFATLRDQLPSPARRWFLTGARLFWSMDRRQASRLQNVGGMLGLALATWAPDDRRMRWTGLARVLSRGLQRKLRRDPA